jgi:hypothetical protein
MRRVVLALVSMLGLPAATAGECLPPEPTTVTLEGRLERRGFVALADAEDEEEEGAGYRHDAVVYVLRPAASVCVEYMEEGSAAVKIEADAVQLLLDPQGYERLRPRLGEHVALRGTLSEAETAHHHTPLVFLVERPPSSPSSSD